MDAQRGKAYQEPQSDPDVGLAQDVGLDGGSDAASLADLDVNVDATPDADVHEGPAEADATLDADVFDNAADAKDHTIPGEHDHLNNINGTSCNEILACTYSCRDQLCIDRCTIAGSSRAQAKHDDYWGCALQECSETGDSPVSFQICVNQYCPNVFSACESDQ